MGTNEDGYWVVWSSSMGAKRTAGKENGRRVARLNGVR